jgi:hypothetical protein
MGLGGDTLQQAIQYFILNRCSFSGSTLSGGFSQEASNGRFTPSSIDRIAALDFADIEIHNADFLEFVESALVAEPDSLVFGSAVFFRESQSYTGTTTCTNRLTTNRCMACFERKKTGC